MKVGDPVFFIAYEDQFPADCDLKQKAADGLIRKCIHFGLISGDRHFMYGERWRPQRSEDFHNEMMLPGLVPTGVRGWRASTTVNGFR